MGILTDYLTISSKTILATLNPFVRGSEIGSTGTKAMPASGKQGGLAAIPDEYNPDLIGEKFYQEIERMSSDSQIEAIMRIVKLPIKGLNWYFEPASDSVADRNIASYLTKTLTQDMFHSWQYFLHHILLSLDYGSMPFEVIWEVATDVQSSPLTGNFPLVRPSKIAPRLPKTIKEWVIDAKGDLLGITQVINREGQEVFIPQERLLVFVYQQTGSNYYGKSILRAARKNWYYKERLERINAVTIEKRGSGTDVLTVGPSATEKQIAKGEMALQSLRTHERFYIVEIEGAIGYRMEGLGQGGVLDPLPSIKYQDRMIAQSVLASFLSLDSGQGGSFAMHKDKSSLFVMTLQDIVSGIIHVINRDLVRPWVTYNWGEQTELPRLTHSPIDTRDTRILAEAITRLTDSDVIRPGDKLEEAVRSYLDLPSKLDDPAREPSANRLANNNRIDRNSGDDDPFKSG